MENIFENIIYPEFNDIFDTNVIYNNNYIAKQKIKSSIRTSMKNNRIMRKSHNFIMIHKSKKHHVLFTRNDKTYSGQRYIGVSYLDNVNNIRDISQKKYGMTVGYLTSRISFKLI